MTTCTYHCATCGRHFHSLRAFDAHRTGDYASNDPDTQRRCVDPNDLDGRLVILADDATCRLAAPDVQTRCRVWTHGKALAQMRARFA